MTLGEIRLVDHPRGREEMLGWLVSTSKGIGVIRGVALSDPMQTVPVPKRDWLIQVEIVQPEMERGKLWGFFPEEIALEYILGKIDEGKAL